LEAKIDADRHRQEQMFQWMQNLSAKMGEPLPQALFLPPRPPEDTPVSTSTIPFFLFISAKQSRWLCQKTNKNQHLQFLAEKKIIIQNGVCTGRVDQ